MSGIIIAILIAGGIVGYLQLRKIRTIIEGLQNENLSVKANYDILQKEIETLKGQIFLREGILLQEKGKWCLEYKGEKKFFKPGKIEKIISANSETDFVYQNDTVVCICRQNGVVVSEITYKANGAPISGKIFEEGKAVKKFEYDDLGQVCSELDL